MPRRCLFCRRAFRPNGVLEQFCVAREVAYDPERGRLWAICEGCGRWTLAPFESRWEALVELERSVPTFRALSTTENISLFELNDLQVVRIGRASIREEAWWRFGKRLARRRHINLGIAVSAGSPRRPGVTRRRRASKIANHGPAETLIAACGREPG